ncbi:MAG: hypothetical protein U0Q55_07555 [Vicinamibacterales bacterium]
MTDLTAWLEGTALAAWVRESPSLWAYPTVLTFHTVGLGIVVGAAAVVDLRLLGYGRKLRVGALAPLFPIMAWGFVLNFISGVLLFVADATHKAGQWIFWVKLLSIFAALWVTFSTRRIVLDHADFDRPDTIPDNSTRLAFTSAILWCVAITAGRLMAYIGVP